MSYITGKGYKLEIDVDLTGTTPDFEEVCIISSDTSWGEVIDTFYKLNSEIANNKVTALDPEFSFTLKVAEDDNATAFLLSKRVSTERTFDAKITDPADTANGVVFAFSSELTSISDPRTIEDVMAIDISLKVSDGTITRTVTSV